MIHTSNFMNKYNDSRPKWRHLGDFLLLKKLVLSGKTFWTAGRSKYPWAQGKERPQRLREWSDGKIKSIFEIGDTENRPIEILSEN